MLIANPIYDVVFKRLMENERVAKFFVSTLLDQTIERIELQPQEFTYTAEGLGLAVFRLDFIATIKTEEGEYKKVLIEVQKARNEIDLMRFRNYLAEHYKKEDLVEGEKQILPITTIYVLGFKLPEIESACLKVNRQYIDLLTGGIIERKSEFVEKLSHDCYIVQVNRIGGRYQTRLEKLLSLFEQNHFLDEGQITKHFPHEFDLEELRLAAEILQHAGSSPQARREIEIEQEAWRSINALFATKEQNYKARLKAQEEMLEEKEQVINQKEQQLSEKERLIREQEQALAEKNRLIEELLDKLKD